MDITLTHNEVDLLKRASDDYSFVRRAVQRMRFEDALKGYDGYNLTVEIINGAPLVYFDFNYGHIASTIFRKSNGRCEICETYEVYNEEGVMILKVTN